MKFSGKRAVALFTVAAMALVACGDDEKTATTDNGGGNCESLTGDTITIVQNAWTASALEAEIMKQLIESQLCVPAEIVEIDENSMFTGMADGTVDFVTEIWPSGIVADEQAFIDDGTVVDMGELGTVGQIGWFVPDYVIADHPSWPPGRVQDPEMAVRHRRNW
jgi:glycine betaine/proline transport system substrate-binding protein